MISFKFLFSLLSSKFANNLSPMTSYWLDTRTCGTAGGGVTLFYFPSNTVVKCSPLGELQIHFLINYNISGPCENPNQCVVFVMIYLSHRS